MENLVSLFRERTWEIIPRNSAEIATRVFLQAPLRLGSFSAVNRIGMDDKK